MLRLRDALTGSYVMVASSQVPLRDLLHSVESRPDIPAGAKFETFLFVDRVHRLRHQVPEECWERTTRTRPLTGGHRDTQPG